MDAHDLRRALRLVAHELNGAPHDWQSISSREHLELALKAADKALVNAHGGDHLAEAAARLLQAIQRREYERQWFATHNALSPKVGGRLIARYGVSG